MQIIKKINKNVALALDEQGAECIVFGKGTGFPSMPYTLSDTSGILRVFRDIDKTYYEAAQNVSPEALLAASDIVNLALVELRCSVHQSPAFCAGKPHSLRARSR